ncbi:hypothetical protein [Flavobacterium sp. LC2016-01]|uniref:hypothetical protein n=1 Tax=Flavobacterium sp. LC2016-01 TaxID=2675876 RepID=UPI0012BAA9CC|nr:hypothetical protein [Flavobacterium sp. LC2016-01]MTH16824.1 hypothetical protein [Flavobacterium sp. LC2016-01]
MKISDDLQKLLPFGYLFLVIMGILKESVFYYQIGINILKYSTIMDILISPIAEFTSHPIILISILSLFVFHSYLPKILEKHRNRKFVKKAFELESVEGLSETEVKSYFNSISVKSLAIVLVSFFIGYGIAGGYAVSHDIKNNKLKHKHTLNFNSGESEQVYLINNNSLYYFYITKGSKTIKIAALGSVKSLELTKNRMIP